MNAKDYIFIDDRSIDSIYPQLCGDVLKEMKIPKINSREDEMDSSVSVSSSLSIINGQEGLNERIAENPDYAGKVLVSYEQKINHIINICKMDSNYWLSGKCG